MNEIHAVPDYRRHRFPPEIIGHAVWRYCRFALSYRDVEELLAERGVILGLDPKSCSVTDVRMAVNDQTPER